MNLDGLFDLFLNGKAMVLASFWGRFSDRFRVVVRFRLSGATHSLAKQRKPLQSITTTKKQSPAKKHSKA